MTANTGEVLGIDLDANAASEFLWQLDAALLVGEDPQARRPAYSHDHRPHDIAKTATTRHQWYNFTMIVRSASAGITFVVLCGWAVFSASAQAQDESPLVVTKPRVGDEITKPVDNVDVLKKAPVDVMRACPPDFIDCAGKRLGTMCRHRKTQSGTCITSCRKIPCRH